MDRTELCCQNGCNSNTFRYGKQCNTKHQFQLYRDSRHKIHQCTQKYRSRFVTQTGVNVAVQLYLDLVLRLIPVWRSTANCFLSKRYASVLNRSKSLLSLNKRGCIMKETTDVIASLVRPVSVRLCEWVVGGV